MTDMSHSRANRLRKGLNPTLSRRDTGQCSQDEAQTNDCRGDQVVWQLQITVSICTSLSNVVSCFLTPEPSSLNSPIVNLRRVSAELYRKRLLRSVLLSPLKNPFASEATDGKVLFLLPLDVRWHSLKRRRQCVVSQRIRKAGHSHKRASLLLCQQI